MGVIVKNGIWYCGGDGSGGSVSTSFEPVLLWEGIEANSVGQTLTMNQSIDDFDAVMVEGCLYLNGEYQEQYTNNIIFKSSYYNKSQEPDHENWGLSLYNGNTSSSEYKHRIVGSFIDNKTLSLTAVNDAKLTKIYGLKFGGGGGNSSGDSTEGLTDEQLAALASETIAAAWPQ